MPDSSGQPRTGTSPVKLGLACLLSVVFVVVLIVQFGGGADVEGAGGADGDESDRPAASREPGSEVHRPEVAAGTDRRGGDPPTIEPWPEFQVEDVVKYDPFAMPAAFSRYRDQAVQDKADHRQEATAADRQRERLEELAEQDRRLTEMQQDGVKAVVGGGNRAKVAVIGSQTVRVGDELNGFRVIAIESDGVVLERPPLK